MENDKSVNEERYGMKGNIYTKQETHNYVNKWPLYIQSK
jgi:hypothetical protein